MYRTENDIWEALLPIIKYGLLRDYPDLAVKRAYQPTTQSDGAAPRLLLYRVGQRLYGWQGAKQVRDEETGRLLLTESWRKEDDFQANALVDRGPKDSGYTAMDVLESLAAWLHSDAGVQELRARGLGLLRVQEIQEIPYEDSKNVFRFSVNLKFTLTYQQTRTREIAAIESVEARIQGV